MSNIYSMEPRVTGKVTLNTTYGPLSIELWGKECPLACKNFIQLCLEGYYDESSFHRLVPGFCLQGGKPNELKSIAFDSCEEGSAIYKSGRFQIETHSRLKFCRRGLLGMVAHININEYDLNVNGSQFFFTLSQSPELNDCATLFGRLTGDTIFNLLRMGDLEIDPKTEEPLYAPKIIDTIIELNPFDDIILRNPSIKHNEIINSCDRIDNNTKNSEKVQVWMKNKNMSLLSFADDEFNYLKGENNLTTKGVTEKVTNTESKIKSIDNTSSTFMPVSNPSIYLQQMKSIQMRETRNKIEQIQTIEEELGFRLINKSDVKSKILKSSDKTHKPTALERHKAKFVESKKRENKDDNIEINTILLLNSFRKKIKVKDDFVFKLEDNNSNKNGPHNYLDICKLHGLLNCLSCRNNFNINLAANPSDMDDKGWMMHKLVFDRKELEEKIKDDLRELVVIDPRDAFNIKNNKNLNKK